MITPDTETLAGLIEELMAFLAGRSPHALGDDAELQALGFGEQRLAALLGGIDACFGVQVPRSELRPEIRTAGELARVLGAYVQNALEVQVPRRRREPSDPPRLLLLGTLARDVGAALARRGWRGAMMAYEEVAQNAGFRAGTLGAIDHIEAADWSQPMDVVRRVTSLYDAGQIDRVLTCDEFALLPAALATTQLGVPGPSLRAVRNTRDKQHMRRVLEQAGLGQLRYAACRDLDEARAFLDRVEGPIVLKPVAGTGSDGVSRVTSHDELAAAFEVAAAARGFSGILCEEYIDGPEVSLEAYSSGGRFVPVALTDKVTDERFLEIGHQQPSVQPQSMFEEISDLAGRALAALGVDTGVTHTEFRIGRRGPVLIETHTRVAGDSIHVLTRLTAGVDLIDVAVASAIGEDVDVRPVPQGRAAAIRFLVGRPGRVRGVRLPEPHEAIHAVQGPAIGKLVTGRSSSRERLGSVIATGETPEIAARNAESFISQIRVDYFEQSGQPAVSQSRAPARNAAPPAA